MLFIDIQNRMYIRKATMDDLPRLMEIFEFAKTVMVASGNKRQWNNGYPSAETVTNDIHNGVCYAVCDDSHRTIATMAFIEGPDPTYQTIYNGHWRNNNRYYVIHRIAVAQTGMGLARKMLDWAFGHTATVRIDTHRDNVIMHHILQSYGFIKCGVIHLANGDARDAYMLTKE